MTNQYYDGYYNPDRTHGSSDAQQGARQRAADDRFNAFYKAGGGFQGIGSHTGPANIELKSNSYSTPNSDVGHAIGSALAGTTIGNLIAGVMGCAIGAGLLYVAYIFKGNHELPWVTPAAAVISLWTLYEGVKVLAEGVVGTVKFIFSMGGVITALVLFVGYGAWLSRSDHEVGLKINGSDAKPVSEVATSVPETKPAAAAPMPEAQIEPSTYTYPAVPMDSAQMDVQKSATQPLFENATARRKEKIYAAPNRNSDVVDVMKVDEDLHVEKEYSNAWYEVDILYSDQTHKHGYIPHDAIFVESAKVNSQRATIFAQPDNSSEPIADFQAGERMKITKELPDWYEVKAFADRRIYHGFVARAQIVAISP